MSSFVSRHSTTIATIVTIVLIGLSIFWVRQEGIVDMDAVGEWVKGLGFRGIVLYGLLFIVLGMIGMSKVAMTVLAGALFSFTEAIIVTVLAASLAAMFGFFLTRYFEGTINRRFMKKKRNGDKSKPQAIVDRIEKNAKERGFYTIAILRLSFVPLMFLSYTSGLVKSLRFKDFAWAIFLTNIYMNLVYILVGDSITRSLPIFGAAIVALLIFMQTPKIVKKYAQKAA